MVYVIKYKDRRLSSFFPNQPKRQLRFYKSNYAIFSTKKEAEQWLKYVRREATTQKNIVKKLKIVRE